MVLRVSNNATSILANTILPDAGTLNITVGDESKFPALVPGSGDWCPIVVVDAAANREIMRCTGRNGVTLTVERGKENTSAKKFDAGARVDVRLTAAAINEIHADVDGVLDFTSATGNQGISWKSVNMAMSSRTSLNRIGVFNAATGGSEVASFYASGNINSVATISGNVINGNSVTSNGAMSAIGNFSAAAIISNSPGRIISKNTATGGTPSVSCWSTVRGTNVGIWNNASSQLGFGSLDGNGVPVTTWGWWDGVSGLTVQTGNIQTTGEIYAGKTISTAATADIGSGRAVYAQTSVNAKTDLTALSGSMVIGADGIHRKMQYASGWQWRWYSNDGSLAYMHNTSQLVLFDAGDGTFLTIGGGKLTIGGAAFKPGGGSWSASSDIRLKNVHGGYEHGLAELLQLNPIRYAYKTEPDIEHIGLVAQDVEAILPELVSLKKGEVDGQTVQDVRQLDPSALTFALINAVKALSAKLDEANERIAALEAR